jgi:hypothetical protein
MEKLNKTMSTRSQQKENDSNLPSLRMTPSQTLLEATELYRRAYGPSVPLPFGLGRELAIPHT